MHVQQAMYANELHVNVNVKSDWLDQRSKDHRILHDQDDKTIPITTGV